MLLALGAAASVLDAVQSLTCCKSSSAASGQQVASGFDFKGSAPGTSGAASSPHAGGSSAISPQTLSALIAAQGQAGANAAPSNPSDALQDLFSQIDANGDGAITKTEFENALGAGGTNLAAADHVFGKLDSSGDGVVSLDEIKPALEGARGHHGHHTHAHGALEAGGGDGDSTSDALIQALSGASSTSVTNSDGSTTTSITYADGSKVSLTTPATSATSATSSATASYNLIERLIQREAQALSASAAAALSVSV